MSVAFEYFKRSVAGAGSTSRKEQKEAKYKSASEGTLLSAKAKLGSPPFILIRLSYHILGKFSFVACFLRKSLGPTAKDRAGLKCHV